MLMPLPLIPDWQSIHPLVVHFPIALLLVAPIFIMLGALRKPASSDPFLLSGLILMGLGFLGTLLAGSSGQAAATGAVQSGVVQAVLEMHRELAVNAEYAFAALTLVYGCILFVPKVLGVAPTYSTTRVLPLAFLVFYATGVVMLAYAAHQGGRLVHEFGVRAQTAAVETHALR